MLLEDGEEVARATPAVALTPSTARRRATRSPPASSSRCSRDASYDDALRRACAAGATRSLAARARSRRCPRPPRSTRILSLTLVEAGDESLRRDDPVALLDPVAQHVDVTPGARSGTVTQPALPGRTRSARRRRSRARGRVTPPSLTEIRVRSGRAREHEDLPAHLDDDGVAPTVDPRPSREATERTPGLSLVRRPRRADDTPGRGDTDDPRLRPRSRRRDSAAPGPREPGARSPRGHDDSTATRRSRRRRRTRSVFSSSSAARTYRSPRGRSDRSQRELVVAAHVHGRERARRSGAPRRRAPCRSTTDAVEFIADTLAGATDAGHDRRDGAVDECRALPRRADGTQGIAQIVLMGGAIAEGNFTPAAEFNIWCDPEAAAVVFECGLDITMIGLDVTHQALLGPEVERRLRDAGRRRLVRRRPQRLLHPLSP